MSEPLSVGLLLGDRRIPRWFVDGLSRAVETGACTIDTVLVAPGSDGGIPEKNLAFYVQDLAEKGCWAPVAIGGKVVERIVGPIPELERRPVTDLSAIDVADVERIRVHRPSEHRYEVSDAGLELLETVDTAIHWGIGILTGEVLSVPQFGVWGVHQGDIRNYRGGPPGFWEYVAGESTAGVTLQQFSEALDAGDIVAEREVDTGDAHTWRTVRRRLCQASVPLVAEGIEAFAMGDGKTVSPDGVGRVYTPSDRDCRTTLAYLRRTVPGWIRTVVKW